MYSWRSRFRRTKTPDAVAVTEIKTSSNLSKNPEDTEQHKKRISRFLRRPKHDDDRNEKPRPRSVFLERNITDFNGNQKTALSPRDLGEPPSVQDILDRNRRERAAGKSPRPWRKFLTGDRSPSTNRLRDSGNTEREDYSYRSKYRDGNKTSDTEKYESSSQISTDSDKYSRRERYSDDGIGRKTGIMDSRNGRKASTDGSWRSGSDNGSEKAKDRSRSASPYDNVDESCQRRRERRPRSLYIEGRTGDAQRDGGVASSMAEKSVPQVNKRRERMRRSDSQETVSSGRSVRSGKTLIEKETYVSRRPQTYYTVEEDGEDKWKPRSHTEVDRGSGKEYRRQPAARKTDDVIKEPRSESEMNRETKSPRTYRKQSDAKSSGYTTDQSTKDTDKVSRVYDKGSYGRRSSENILGATLNYMERKPSYDYLSTATTKMVDESTESPRERRRRMRGLRGDNIFDNGSVRDAESESNSGSARRKHSYSSTVGAYKASTESTAYTTTGERRDSYGKIRPKSLYDFHERVPSLSDSPSKLRQDDGSSLHTERYRSRNDNKAKDDEKSKLRRPRTLFLVEKENNDSAYRGNWSVNVPKKPDHLKDFSKPDESATGYNWRKNKKEEEIGTKSVVFDQDRDVERGERIPLKDRIGERAEGKVSSESLQKNRKKKEDGNGSILSETDRSAKEKDTARGSKYDENNRGERVSYIRRQSQQAVKDFDKKPEIKIPAFELTVSQPSNEEVFDKDVAKEENKLSILGEDTIVRRRRREHAPPARPSSIYHVKSEEKSSDLMPAKREDKTEDDKKEEYDPIYRTRRRPHVNLDSEDIKTGLRKKSAVERRLRNKNTKERPKSVNLADVFSVSNDRSSGYLTKVKIHDPLRDTVDDVKREFDKLLRRTEDWKLRTDSLNSKATVLSSSYRSLNKAITGIRDESDDMYAVIENIGERLSANDSIGYPDTEEEWRRAFEAGKLVEKALRGLEYQKRNPKPEFEYSDSESEPGTPEESFYDMPKGIPWYSRLTSRENSSSRLYGLTDQYSTRKANDYLDRGSTGYLSNRPSLDVMSSLSVSTSARFSPSYVTDVYSRRSRYQDSLTDYRGASRALSVSSSSSGRFIPETAV